MAFYVPGKPYLNNLQPLPPQSPLAMNSINKNFNSVQNETMSYASVTVRRNPSTVSRSGKPKGPPENKSSILLSLDENQKVFELLGNGRQTLSTSVVQLLFPTPDNQWRLRDVGVLCFVRDSNRRSYFLEILSLRMMKAIFSQEIYEEFVYRQPSNKLRFISFEGDEFTVGLSFANWDELKEFRSILDSKMAAKRQRQIERQSRMYDQANHNNNIPLASPTISSANLRTLISGVGSPKSPTSPSPYTTNQSQISQSPTMTKTSFGTMGRVGALQTKQQMQQSDYAKSTSNFASTVPTPKIQTNQISTSVMTANQPPIATTISLNPPTSNNKKGSGFAGRNIRRKSSSSGKNNKKGKQTGKGSKAGKKEKLTKADIGCPTNFVHIEHAGFDKQNQFKNDVFNEKYKDIFNKAGVSRNQLEDEGTRNFIYSFIDTYEQKTMEDNTSPSADNSRHFATAPVVSQSQNAQHFTSQALPPPVPARAADTRRKSLAPSPPVIQMQSKPTNNSNQVYAAPPAPPPLPTTQNLTSTSGGQMVQSQNNGPPPPPPPLPASTLNEDLTSQLPTKTSNQTEEISQKGNNLPAERSNLLKEIQEGISLKKVEPGQKLEKAEGGISPSAEGMDGLALALSKALAERSRAIHSESSSSDDEDANNSDSDEWK